MIPMEDGLVGVVLARYTRSDDVRNDVRYIVELRGGSRGNDEVGTLTDANLAKDREIFPEFASPTVAKAMHGRYD